MHTIHDSHGCCDTLVKTTGEDVRGLVCVRALLLLLWIHEDWGASL